MKIDNTLESFVELWQKLESTHEDFLLHYRRFCIRRIMKKWFTNVKENTIWEVCQKCDIGGYALLGEPSFNPAMCREFLRALTSVFAKIFITDVNGSAINTAYTAVFHKPIKLYNNEI